MPFGRITKKHVKKGMKPRAKSVFFPTQIPVQVPIFGRKRTIIRSNLYQFAVQVTAGASVPSAPKLIVANGLYDPTLDGSTQPMGFDQFMLSYEHYTVTHAKIRVRGVNTSTADPTCFSVGIYAGSTALTSNRQIVENGQCKTKWLHRDGMDNIGELSYSVNIAKFFNRKTVLNDNDYRGTISANPTEKCYFHIYTWNPFDATTGNVITFDITVQFKAVLQEPRPLSLS